MVKGSALGCMIAVRPFNAGTDLTCEVVRCHSREISILSTLMVHKLSGAWCMLAANNRQNLTSPWKELDLMLTLHLRFV